jgi:hypothetical protein
MSRSELSPEEQAQDDFEQHAINYTGHKYSLYHVSPADNRPGIEKTGLEASTVNNGLDERDEQFYEKGPGVWVAESPQHDYGDDIYGIHKDYDTERDREDHDFIPHDVPTSDFKRVGHTYFNPNGHTEVHWHKEEYCPQLQPKLFEDK